MKEKFIIYQMLPRVFGSRSEGNPGKFGDLTSGILKEISGLQVRYIWYTGILRHALPGEEGVKGGAGSPFAISDYHDVNPYLSANPSERMKEFEALVARTAAAGMGTLIDFVPNHVSRVYHSCTDNFSEINYYPGKIYDGDWSDTAKLNYNCRDTWEKMKRILLFWAGKGIAGFRCDMIELVPAEFWEWCIPEVRKEYPGLIFIGEAYQPENYRKYLFQGHFDYLYDKTGFYDHLKGILRGHEPAGCLTGQWQQLGDLQPYMLNFLENHDEERITSPDFAGNPFRGIAALFVSLFFNKAPFMLYMGQEFGEGPEKTSIFDFCSLPTLRKWIAGIEQGSPLALLDEPARDLYAVYHEYMKKAVCDPVLREGETFDLQYVNPKSPCYDPEFHFSFLRNFRNKTYLCAANFTDRNVTLQIHIPKHAFEYFGIEESETFNAERPISLEIAQNSGSLLRIR